MGKADLDRLGARPSAVTVRKPKPVFPAKGKTRKGMLKRDEERFAKAHSDHLHNRIPAASRDAITAYTGGPDRLNIPLRSGRKVPATIQKDVDRKINKVITGNAPKPPRAGSRLPRTRLPRRQPEAGRHDPAEVDDVHVRVTSTDPSIAAGFGFEMFEIRPKRGVYVEAVTRHKGEKE